MNERAGKINDIERTFCPFRDNYHGTEIELWRSHATKLIHVTKGCAVNKHVAPRKNSVLLAIMSAVSCFRSYMAICISRQMLKDVYAIVKRHTNAFT